MKEKILIVDDDLKLNRLLEKYLSDFNFEVSSVSSPLKALKLIKKNDYDLLILDIMLPELDGFEVCKIIRRSSTLPIIMLTARGELTDKVVGFELGADDYLAKPFEPRELVARIQSVLRRAKSAPLEQQIQVGELSVDVSRQEVFLAGDKLELTSNEFAILTILVSHPGKVFNRDKIMQELRGIDCDAFTRSVDITISRLRQKLGDDPKKPAYIKTIHGAGYLFLADQQPTGSSER